LCVVPSETQDSDAASSPAVKIPQHFDDEAGPQWPIVANTFDHKPTLPIEKARIEAAGGFVSNAFPPRLDGIVAVSRAIGDFCFKGNDDLAPAEQKMSCIPDIYEVSGLLPGTFIILACDGLWDVMSSEEAACFVRRGLLENARADVGQIAAQLVNISLKKGSYDNISVMIIQFADGSDWAAHPDEMMNCEKWLNAGSGGMSESLTDRYVEFLKKCKFPLFPKPCPESGRYFKKVASTATPQS